MLWCTPANSSLGSEGVQVDGVGHGSETEDGQTLRLSGLLNHDCVRIKDGLEKATARSDFVADDLFLARTDVEHAFGSQPGNHTMANDYDPDQLVVKRRLARWSVYFKLADDLNLGRLGLRRDDLMVMRRD